MDQDAMANKQQRKQDRAEAFAASLKRTGLGLTEFGKLAGFSRNVIYNLSRGQRPTSEEQAQRLAKAFEALRKS